MATSMETLAVAAFTAFSTLGGVFLPQYSARNTQREQANAAALLDRERRDAVSALEKERHERDINTDRWEQRRDAYREFLSAADEMSSIQIQAATAATVGATVEKLSRAQWNLALLAPERVALCALLLADSARKVPVTEAGTRQRDEAQLKYSDTLMTMLQVMRKDLEVEGDMGEFIARMRKHRQIAAEL